MAIYASHIGGIPSTVTTLQNQYGPAKKFSSRQKAFNQSSEQIVQTAAETIRKIAAEKNPDFTSLFHTLIAQFAQQRREIAIKAKTKNAEDFGKSIHDFIAIDLKGDCRLCTQHLLLEGVYKEVNTLTVQRLSKRMSSMNHTLKEFIQKTDEEEETVLNRRFSYHIEIVGPEELRKRGWDHDTPPEVFQALYEEGEPAMTSFKLVEKLRKASPNVYKASKMFFYLKKLVETYPSPTVDPSRTRILSGTAANFKSDYVLVTLRAQIKQKMYATNQWLTWLYRSENRDPFERMTDPKLQPVITLLHEDVFLKNDTLAECAHLFDDLMSEKISSIPQLKNQVALLRYLFAQTMLYLRGTGAIGEWLEDSIYRAHGLTRAYKPNYEKENVDVLALTTLKFSDYLDRYHTLVQICPSCQPERPLEKEDSKEIDPSKK